MAIISRPNINFMFTRTWCRGETFERDNLRPAWECCWLSKFIHAHPREKSSELSKNIEKRETKLVIVNANRENKWREKYFSKTSTKKIPLVSLRHSLKSEVPCWLWCCWEYNFPVRFIFKDSSSCLIDCAGLTRHDGEIMKASKSALIRKPRVIS